MKLKFIKVWPKEAKEKEYNGKKYTVNQQNVDVEWQGETVKLYLQNKDDVKHLEGHTVELTGITEKKSGNGKTYLADSKTTTIGGGEAPAPTTSATTSAKPANGNGNGRYTIDETFALYQLCSERACAVWGLDAGCDKVAAAATLFIACRQDGIKAPVDEIPFNEKEG